MFRHGEVPEVLTGDGVKRDGRRASSWCSDRERARPKAEPAKRELSLLAGQDYTTTSGKPEFAAGEKVKLLTIPILNDRLKEGSESFRLYLTNVSAGVILGTPASAGIAIADNDFGVQIESINYWVQENEGTLTLRIRRGNDVDLSAFTVDYATTNMTATAGEDYTETKGTLEFL